MQRRLDCLPGLTRRLDALLLVVSRPLRVLSCGTISPVPAIVAVGAPLFSVIVALVLCPGLRVDPQTIVGA
jgi:hypothetical protein